MSFRLLRSFLLVHAENSCVRERPLHRAYGLLRRICLSRSATREYLPPFTKTHKAYGPAACIAAAASCPRSRGLVVLL
jgi:hypothetical protein